MRTPPSERWVADVPAPIGRLAVSAIKPLLVATCISLVLVGYLTTGMHFVALERSWLQDPATIDAADTWTAIERWSPSGDLIRSGEPAVAPVAVPGCQAARTLNWKSEGVGVLQLTAIVCVDAMMAGALAKSVSEAEQVQHFASDIPAGFGTEWGDGPFVLASSDGRLLIRIWSSQNRMFSLTSACGSSLEECDQSNARHAQELSSLIPVVQVPGPAAPERNRSAAVAFAWLCVALAAAYACGVLLPRFVAWRREPKAIRDFPEGLHDIGESAKVQANSRAAIGVGTFLVAVSVVRLLVAMFFQIRNQSFGGDLTSPIVWGGLLSGLGLRWLGRRVVRRRDFRYLRQDGESLRSGIGSGLVAAARWGLGVSLVLIVLTLVGYVVGLPGWALHADIATIDAAIQPPHRLVVPIPLLPIYFSTVASARGLLWLLGLLLGACLGLLATHSLGARLAAASLRESVQNDGRPPVLLLRSFEEDEARVTARTLAPGWLPLGLTPVPRLPLEQVLAHGLSTLGPVIGIAPPGTRLPQLGAAKKTLQHSEWRTEIARLASEALVVVVLATPATVSREGLGWEIDLLTQKITHSRLIVVLGPYSEADRDRRWRGFCGYAEDAGPFAGLAAIVRPGALRIAVRSQEHDWRLYGGSKSDDVTYLAALSAACRSMEQFWREESSSDCGGP